jgi:quinol monooxygenase YgiN
MAKFAFRVELKATPGKEPEIEASLKHAAVMAKGETGIVSWTAVKEEGAPGVYGLFDTFNNAVDRDAHGAGELAKALFAKAEELFSEAPKVHRLDVIAEK